MHLVRQKFLLRKNKRKRSWPWIRYCYLYYR